MKKFTFTIILVLISVVAWAQERVDITTCEGTGTGIVCVAPRDSLYKLCVKVTPGPCTNKNYTIDWGDNKIDKILLNTALTLTHEYDLRDFVRNCSNGEFKVSIFVENATCPNDNKGFRVTFNKNPQAKPLINNACEGSSVSINNGSCPVSSDISFLWEFSDGQTSTSTYPSISFSDPTKTYKVKLTATSKNCGNSTTEADFKIDKRSVPDFKATGTAVVGNDTVVCISGGGVISLDGTVSSDETGYYWQISGGQYSYVDKTTSNSDVIKIKLEEVKQYTISLTTRNNCGESKPLIRRIKVVDLPTLKLTPQPDVCEEIKYKIGSPVADAKYTLNGKAIDPGQEISLPLASAAYIVSATLTNACGTQVASDTFTVASAQPVKILSFPKDTTICVSTSAILLSANVDGGNWSTAGIETQNGRKVFIPQTAGSYTISYEKGTGKCYSKDEVKVKVDGIQATASDQTICAGTPQIRLKGSPAGGIWTTQSCLNCIKGDTLLTANLSANQVEVTYSVANTSGCRATATAKISFGRPKAGFTMNGGCTGGTFQPVNSSSGAGEYVWLVNGLRASTDASPKLALLSGLQKIMLIARSGDCADTLQQAITITAPPPVISFTPSVALGCSPLKVQINVNGSAIPDVQYTWDFGNTVTYTGFQPPSQLFENDAKENRDFKVTVTAKNGCGQQSDSKVVVVRPLARAEIGVDSTTLRCTPALLLFSNRSSGHDKDQSRWLFGDGTSRQTGSDTVYHSFSARDNAKTFKVQLEITSACGRDTAEVDILVYPTNVKALYTISKSEVCPGEVVKFTDASVPKPNKWIWKFGDGTISTVANPSHTFSLPQKEFKVTLIAFTSCGYDSTQLTVRTTETVAGTFVENPVVCEGSAVQFVNQSNLNLGFVWDFGDGSPSDSANYSPVHTYSKAGNYTTTLSVYRGTQACKVLAKKSPVSVVSPVVAGFGFNGDSIFCAPGPVNLVNLSKNADSFTWYFSDGRVSDVKTPSLPFEPGQYSIKLIASKGGVCKDSVERALAFSVNHCQLDIPQAFSPNGDGIGDRYTLFGSGILEIDQLLIRNRWGEVVFKMKNAPPGSQRPEESWDGTFDGKPMPSDMYVYEAVVLYIDKRKSEKLRGNIYLAR